MKDRRFLLFPSKIPAWVLNFATIAMICASLTSITKAQADTLWQSERQGYSKRWGGPAGSPGEDCEFIITKSSANFAKHSVTQPGKYRKVVFVRVDSIPDEIRFQENLEEIQIYIDQSFGPHNYHKAKPDYISREVLQLPRLKSVSVFYGKIHIDVAVNLLNPNLEHLEMTMFKEYFSKTDPSTLHLPENLTYLSINMIDELGAPILNCKKLKTFAMSGLDMELPAYFNQVTSLENLSMGLFRFDTLKGFADLNALTNLQQLNIYNRYWDKTRGFYFDLSSIKNMGIKHIKLDKAEAGMIAQLCRFPELESLTFTHLDYYGGARSPHCGSQTLSKLALAGDLWFELDSLGIDWSRLRHLALKCYEVGDEYFIGGTWFRKSDSAYTLPLLPDITLAPDADTLVLINIEPTTTRLLTASPGLRHVVLASNNLKSLPPACSTWVQLHYLEISGNKLSDLPDGLQALQSLDTLYLDENRFTRFPRVLLRGLSPRLVSLTSNQLTRIPQDIDQLAHTEVLDLRRNQIARIPRATLRAIARMPRLKELRLANNPIRAEDIPMKFRGKIVF
jgi:Leucine-rich repeat (LRR) protein